MAGTSNYHVFRDCFSSAFLDRLSRPSPKDGKKRSGHGHGRKSATKPVDAAAAAAAADGELQGTDAEELADFVDFLASETFSVFPRHLRTLSYSLVQNDSRLAERYADYSAAVVQDDILPLVPPGVVESLSAYSLLPPSTSFPALLSAAILEYVSTTTAPPPAWSATRTSACEICQRDWIPLTYHHLIPKQVHDKALKRGWHEEWQLNSVAWLCRACHSYVHKVASNEELARDYWTVEKLMERADLTAWAGWVAKVRWKAR